MHIYYIVYYGLLRTLGLCIAENFGVWVLGCGCRLCPSINSLRRIYQYAFILKFLLKSLVCSRATPLCFLHSFSIFFATVILSCVLSVVECFGPLPNEFVRRSHSSPPAALLYHLHCCPSNVPVQVRKMERNPTTHSQRRCTWGQGERGTESMGPSKLFLP